MYPLKQATVIDVLFFAFDSNGDGVTGKVDGDFTKRISKNGGVFAAMTVTITERENGFYHLQLSAAHSDTLGIMTVSLASSGIKRVNLQYRVHARLPDDLASQASLDIVDDFVDTEIANIQSRLPATLTGGGNIRSEALVVSDKAGYALSTAGIQAIWDALTSALTTVGSVGKLIVDNINATISSRATPAQVQSELVTYGALKPTVAARTLDVTATGEAGIDWANIGAPTTSQTLSGTTVGTVTNLTNDPPGVTTLLGRITATIFTGITSMKEWLGLLAGKQVANATARTEIRSSGAGSGTYDETTDSQEATRDNMGTAQTGDSFARLGAPAGASVSADIAAIEAQTDDIGIAGAGLTALGDVRLANLNATVSSRASQSSVDLVDDFVDTEVSAIKAVTDKLDTALELDGPVYRYTVNALENAPSGTGASAATIADAVWDEAISGHLTGGSTGAALNGAGSAGDPWTTPLPGVYGAGTAGKILGDNLNAPITSRASQASLDTLDDFVDTEVAAIKAKTDNLPIDPADASDIAAGFSLLTAKVDVIDDFLDTEVAAIKAKTDALPSDPADASDIAASFVTVNAKLDAIDDFVDTEVAAIKAKTDQLAFTGGTVNANATISLSAADLNAIADALLKRDMSAVVGEASRSPINALRFLRNKFSIAGVTLTVTKEDDATPAWTSTLTTDAAAVPIVGSDPA